MAHRSTGRQVTSGTHSDTGWPPSGRASRTPGHWAGREKPVCPAVHWHWICVCPGHARQTVCLDGPGIATPGCSCPFPDPDTEKLADSKQSVALVKKTILVPHSAFPWHGAVQWEPQVRFVQRVPGQHTACTLQSTLQHTRVVAAELA